MYSSACQRVITLTRLPTLALPATAPTSGSANQRTSLRIDVGREIGVGIERHDDLAPRLGKTAIERGRLAAIGDGDEPHARVVARMKCAPPRRVSSLEPSSMTMTSRLG